MFRERHFAFILETKSLLNIFLIEISKWTKFKKTTVRFYESNVLYCPIEMKPIFETIMDNYKLKRNTEVAKLSLVTALKKKIKNKYYLFQQITIDVIIITSIEKYFNK